MNIFRRVVTAAVAVILFGVSSSVLAQYLPSSGGYTSLPDGWLLGKGLPWHYKAKRAAITSELKSREPTNKEKSVIERANFLLANRAAKAILLTDGNQIVYMKIKPPADDHSLFYGMSMGKSVTSMAIGKAICANKIRLDQEAGELVPRIHDKSLGKARVRDLLRMASGSASAFSDSTIHTKEQLRDQTSGAISWLDIIADERVAAARKGLFSAYGPGEIFDYKTTDPIVLGVAMNLTTGTRFTEWIHQSVLIPAGTASDGVLGQDKAGFADSASGVRLTLADWLRFAYWVQQSSRQEGCFGDYVRTATSTQIKNTEKKFGTLFDGYGYFFWTENKYAKNSFWSSGYGGQRIGWSTKNDRILIAFSNVEDWMPELYQLAAAWEDAE